MQTGSVEVVDLSVGSPNEPRTDPVLLSFVLFVSELNAFPCCCYPNVDGAANALVVFAG